MTGPEPLAPPGSPEVKFFTREWWAGGCKNAQAIFERYNAYFQNIRSLLPPAFVEFETAHTLHAAELKHARCNFMARSVALVFDGWDVQLQHRVRYSLDFKGVSCFEQQLPQEPFVEVSLGPVGYWECAQLHAETELRMLFASGAQFRIVFTGFAFQHERREAP